MAGLRFFISVPGRGGDYMLNYIINYIINSIYGGRGIQEYRTPYT